MSRWNPTTVLCKCMHHFMLKSGRLPESRYRWHWVVTGTGDL